MRRRDFLKVVSVGAAGAVFGDLENLLAGKGKGDKPNIIIIYHDDLNRNYTGFCGSKIPTPHMDRVAREGAIMDRFYITSSVCTPSRYTILTGRYAGKCRALLESYPVGTQEKISWNTDILPGEKTVGHVMKSAGYVTGMVGKWHLGTLDEKYAPAKINKNAAPDDAANNAIMKANNDLGREYVKKTGGFDYVESLYMKNIKNYLPISMMYHNMDWVTQGAVNFIEQNRKKPFFLYMATTLPHGPHPITDSIKSDARFTAAGPLDEAPNVQASRQSILDRLAKHNLSQIQSGGIWADDAVGAVLKKLDDLGIADDTVIIVTSDHQAYGKYTIYEGAHVPCAIRWPNGIKAGTVCKEITSNVDILPTCGELGGAKVDAEMGVDGESFLGLVTGKDVACRKALLLEIGYAKGVVTDRWKYIAIRFPKEIQKKITADNRDEFCQDGKHGEPSYRARSLFPGYFDDDQLYDLKADPTEQKNLASDPKYAGVLKEMKGELKNLLKDCKHVFGEFTG